MDDNAVISRSWLFQGCTTQERDRLLLAFSARPAAGRKGQLLHKPGTAMERFGLVLTGGVQALMDDINGQRMIMADVGPGGTFGEALHFLGLTDSPVYIMAAADCRLLWLDARFLRRPGPEDGEAAARFLTMTARRTLEMNQRIQVLSKRTLRLKLITLFSQYAAAHGSQDFTLPMDRAALADYLGADRSALSRELSRMRREGLVSYERSHFRLLGGDMEK